MKKEDSSKTKELNVKPSVTKTQVFNPNKTATMVNRINPAAAKTQTFAAGKPVTKVLSENTSLTKTQTFNPNNTSTMVNRINPAAAKTQTFAAGKPADRNLVFNPRSFNTKTIETRLLQDNLTRQVEIEVKAGTRFWSALKFMFIVPYLRYRRLRKWFFIENRKLMDQVQIIDKMLIQKFNLICNGLNLSRRFFTDVIGFENAIRDSFAFITTPYSPFPIFVAEKDKLVSQIDFMWHKIVAENPRINNVPVIQDLEKRLAEIDNELSIQRKFYVIVVRDFNSRVQEQPLIPAKYKLGLFPVLEKDVAKRISVAAFKV